jgi:hypothetical protein
MLAASRRQRYAKALLLLCLNGCEPAKQAVSIDAPDPQPTFDHRLPAYGGELLGSNRGEFGGELSFRSRDGAITRLMEKNVVGLYSMPFGFVAVTALAHLRVNEGEILVISRIAESRLRVDNLAVLPAAPMEARQRSDGSIEMRLFSGHFAKDGNAIHQCWVLEVDKRLHRSECPPDWPASKGWGSLFPRLGSLHT